MISISDYNIGDVVTPSEYFNSKWEKDKFNRIIVEIIYDILILNKVVILPKILKNNITINTSLITKAFHYSYFNIDIKKMRKIKLKNIKNRI